MKFSLVVCTLGRYDDVRNLFLSLFQQEYKDFEIILVDQNSPDYLSPILDEYKNKLNIKHIASVKGLSVARNNGLKHVRGDIVCFPDDDCMYSERTLLDVHNFFLKEKNVSAITSGYSSPEGVIGLNSPSEPKQINKINVWKSAISFTIFVRKKSIDKLNYYFDETLGVGSNTKWGAGEETDFLLRIIENDTALMIPDLGIRHPVKESFFHDYDKQRVQSYARGMGRVLRLRRYNIILVLLSFLLTSCKIVKGYLKKDNRVANFYMDTLVNRIKGYLDKP